MNDYLAKVHELVKQMNNAPDVKTVIDIVADSLPKLLNATYCSLFILNPASKELELKAHNHENIGDDPFINVSSQQQSIMNMTMARNESVIVRDLQDEIGLENKDKYKSKSFMCLLIKHNERILGVINLADKQDGQFEQSDLMAAGIVAELMGPLLSHQDFCQI